jgi:hypothetical protein
MAPKNVYYTTDWQTRGETAIRFTFEIASTWLRKIVELRVTLGSKLVGTGMSGLCKRAQKLNAASATSNDQHLVIRTIEMHVIVDRVQQTCPVTREKWEDGIEALLQVLVRVDQVHQVARLFRCAVVAA